MRGNVGLARVLVTEVGDADGSVALPEPVDPPDTLFDTHWAPVHAVVRRGAAEPEVQLFGRGVGAQQDIGRAAPEAASGVAAQ